MMSEPVYITGIGCVLPGATGHAELRTLLGLPDSQVDRAPPDCTSPLAAIGEFDSSRWVRPIKARRMNRIGLLATVAAHLALESAGIPDDGHLPETTGIALGTGLGCTRSIDEFFRQTLVDGPDLANPAIFSTSIPNAIASQVAMRLSIRGPNVTVSQREVSGEIALLLGMDWIRSGRAERVLVGGADEFSNFLPQHLAGLGQVAASGEPSCPFDQRSTGAAVGEGVTFLLLEGSGGKERRRARVTAGAMLGTPVPGETVDRSGTALRACIEDCRAESQASPGLVVCGASGDRDLDLAHARALRDFPGGEPPLITAPKGMFGESISSGVLAAAVGVIALTEAVAPGLPDLQDAIPECHGMNLPRAPTEDLELSSVLIAGIASGGAAAAIVLES